MTKKGFGWKNFLMIILPVLALAVCVEIIIECSGLILFGVEVDGIAVGGCTKEKAATIIAEHYEEKSADNVVLSIDGLEYRYSKKELGMEPDINSAVEAAYAVGRRGSLAERLRRRNDYEIIKVAENWNKNTFLKNIRPLENLYNIVPAEAKVRGLTAEGAIVQPEQNGRYMDVEDIFHQLQNSESGDIVIEVKFNTWYSYPTEEYIDGWQLNNPLAEFSTAYDPESNRGKNIELFAASLNGAVLYPYQVFSVNERAGERTADKGYLSAPSVVRGRTDNDIGGGICQVVSTLYNAVLKADFKVVERHAHTKPPVYVEQGMDAAVSFGTLDFRCYYRGNSPVILKITADDGWLCVRICGRQ